ncbi:uncharacterized protein LOC120989620 [Bufo bufo]|uniref:uncharacterized protein LOC120989620 n=1 Tax=Bufo bufo TaxID=8384 RepID=UPI001ABDD6AA|nr:uncharacterized protein LOC120989620 [Bufo bufo]
MSSLTKMEEAGCDSETLIRLVQAKRCLYDIQDANYKNRRSRQQAWEDIGQNIWPQWKRLSKTGKEGQVNLLKNKWKSLKDAFIRHRRKEREQRSGASPSARSSYVHVEQMAFLIPCTEMRSTDSSWSQSQQQEEEEEEVTRDSEACVSTGPLSPPPPNPTPPFQTPTQPPPPVVETENIRTHLPKRRRPDRQEDRLIACLDALAHPAPKLSCDGLFLLSLEEKMQQVPRSRITEARDTLTRALDSFIPHYDITQPNNAPQHPPQHPPTTHTYTSQTYPQTNIPHPHDTWHTQPQSSYSYPSTSMGNNTSTTTQMQPAHQSGGMREAMRDPEPHFAFPQYQNL